MKPDVRSESKTEIQVQPDLPVSTNDRRIEARRKFLRTGAGGSAALVVTVMHKRAFAGKKGGNVVASNCTSLLGTPDLIKANKKKALEVSAMGTHKNMICRPKGETPTYPGNPTKRAKHYDQNGNQPFVYSAKQFENGLGDLNLTLTHANNYRLYEKGYCPIVYDQFGLRYNTSAVYYVKEKKSGFLTPNSCKI